MHGVLDGAALTIAQVAAVARGKATALLAPAARARLTQGRVHLEHLVQDGRPHYGVNTGFGSLSRWSSDIQMTPRCAQ